MEKIDYRFMEAVNSRPLPKRQDITEQQAKQIDRLSFEVKMWRFATLLMIAVAGITIYFAG